MRASIEAKGRHILGKLSRNCDLSAPRNCEAALTWELRRLDTGKLEFSASGEVWNHIKSDIIHGGQCVDELADLFPRDRIAQRIRETWAAYHLNGMNPGTPEQMRAAEEGRARIVAKMQREPDAHTLFHLDKSPNWYAIAERLGLDKMDGHYGVTCYVLEEAGARDVPVTDELRASALGGLPEGATTYRYGSRHLHSELPAHVVDLIRAGFKVPGENGETDPTASETAPHPFDVLGLDVTSVFIPWSRSRNAKEKAPSLNWRCTLTHKGVPLFSFDYSAGSAHCPAHKNASLKTCGPRDFEAGVREECERGHAVKRVFSLGSFVHGDAIKPDRVQVIDCLLRDASACDMSFADWCAECGYDTDSISARRAYDELSEQGHTLRAAIGRAAFDDLRAAL